MATSNILFFPFRPSSQAAKLPMTSFSELRQRLLHPYYILHIIYGSFYVFIRSKHLISTQSINFEDNEIRSFMVLFGMSVWKCFMSATAEELSSVLILYTKFFTLCSLFWRFGFWKATLYTAGWIALSTFFPQPWYRGPTKIYELNESAFRDKVQQRKGKKPVNMQVDEIQGPRITEIDDSEPSSSTDNKSKADLVDPKYWIVMLYANWSVACLNFEAVLAKLSVKYDVPHLKFGQVDIDIYPDLAEEFGVSKDPASFDLPTLILFQQGKELKRLPELSVTKGEKTSTANAAKDTITRLGWSKKPGTVISVFQLDKIVDEKIN